MVLVNDNTGAECPNAVSKWERSTFVLIVHWFYVEQEEALQAFIQPETLDGPNQYFCERCKKKCDARKVSQIRDDDCLVLYHISGSYAVFFSLGPEIPPFPIPADSAAETLWLWLHHYAPH